VEKEQLSF